MAITHQLSDYVRSSHLPGVTNVVSKASPIWMDLWKKRRKVGGDKFTWSMRHRGINTAQSWSEFATARVVQREIHTTPSLDLISIAVPVSLSVKKMKRIKSKAEGAVQLINYVDEYASAGKDAMNDHLGQSIWTDGTPVVNDYTDRLDNLTGLKAILARDTSYAGVATTDVPEWNPCQIDFTTAASGDWAGFTITGTNALADIDTIADHLYLGSIMDAMISQSTWDGKQTTLIVADINGYNMIQRMLHPLQRINTDIGYGSFKGIFWQGIPVWCDRNASVLGSATTKANIVGLNMEYFELGCVPGAEVSFDDFVKIPASDAMVGMYLFDGQMGCRDRRSQWSIINIPTA